MGFFRTFIKQAAITDEDIAAALAGLRSRAHVTPEELREFASQQGERAYTAAKNDPLIGGAVGGGLGALLGGALSYSKRMPSWYGKALGAGLGGAAGTGLGLLAGMGRRHLAKGHGLARGHALGEIVQEGRIPRNLPGGITPDELLPYAKGIQEQTAKPLSPTEYQTIRTGLRDELMGEGRLMWDTGDGDSSDNMGALMGLYEAREKANLLADLYERGYGHLAGRLYEQ